MNRFAVLIALLAALLVIAVPPSASAWAPVGQATVHPGVQVFTAEPSYLRSHTGFTGVRLVPGTQPFKADLVGAILGS